jgi:3-hydroxyisobutyrate dehydrogenase-like beta-hydroxyacid dehydrogenase
MKVGVIGLGRMGGPMAAHILAGGHALTILDVLPDAMEGLADKGARIAQTPAEVAEQSEIVLTSLPGAKEVETVMIGDDGVLSGATRGMVVLDASTVGPALSRRLSARFAEKGIDYLDSPVSGAVAGAKAGTLTIMVGGERAAFDRAMPVLDCIGSRVHHMGPSGSGNGIKLVNQLIVTSYFAAFMEGVALADRLEIPVEKTLEILGASYADQPSMRSRFDKILRNDFSPPNRLNSSLEDITLVCELAAELNLGASIAEAAADSYRRAEAQGFGENDLVSLRAMYAKSKHGSL